MKAIIRTLSLWLGVAALTAASAVYAASDFKVAVIDAKKLLAEAPQAAEASKRLEKEFQAKKDQFMEKQKEYRTKEEKMERDKAVMSTAEKTKLEKELGKLQQDMRGMEEDFRNNYMTRQREEMEHFGKTVRDAVGKVAKDEKISMVLLEEVTMYAGDATMDITDKVLKRLKQMDNK